MAFIHSVTEKKLEHFVSGTSNVAAKWFPTAVMSMSLEHQDDMNSYGMTLISTYENKSISFLVCLKTLF
jgi:hypothetical protein